MAARRKLNRLLWTLALVLLAFFALKTFIGDVFSVTYSSMEPTINAGERVLVLYGGAPPERFDLVVISRGGETYVKRVAGLGEESVSIRSGDLFIGNAVLPPDALRPAPIPVFDEAVQDVAEHFAMGGTQVNPWTRVEDGWELDAREVARDSAAGLLRLHKGVEQQHEDVGDLIVACSFIALEPGGRVRLVLVEQGDTFEFSMELANEGTADVALTRLSAEAGKETLATAVFPFETGRWIPVRFANLDNHLRVEYGAGPEVLEAGYAKNTLHPKDTHGDGISLGERVKVGGEGCHARFKDLRVWRDLHYTRRDTFGVKSPVRVGPDELFVLGDNSAASSDSREWGPIDRRDVRGRPVWVVWPPSAIRRLR